jgi:hypothetical protein
MTIPTIAVKIPAMMRTSQMDRWMPGSSGFTPAAPKWMSRWRKCWEANQPAM